MITATMTVINLVVADHWRHTDVDDALEGSTGHPQRLACRRCEGALDQVRELFQVITSWTITERCVRLSASPQATRTSEDLATSLFGSRVNVWTCAGASRRWPLQPRTTHNIAGTPSGQPPCRIGLFIFSRHGLADDRGSRLTVCEPFSKSATASPLTWQLRWIHTYRKPPARQSDRH